MGLADCFNRAHASIRFRDAKHAEVVISGTKHDIPGDGVYSHISLCRSVARKIGLPVDLVEWPRVPGYTTGSFGELFGKQATFQGDIDALRQVENDPKPETTVEEWGGIYASKDVAQLYDDHGEMRRLDSEGEYYINVRAPKALADQFQALNPSVKLQEDGPGFKRVIGGKYNYATKLTPPPLVSVEFRTWDLKPKTEVEPEKPACAEPSRRSSASAAAPTYGSRLRQFESASLRGNGLRDKFNGDLLTSLAKKADPKVRKEKLKRFNERGNKFAPDTDLNEALGMAKELARGSECMYAFLLKQFQQLFLIDFEDRLVTPRSHKNAESDDDSASDSAQDCE